MEKIKVLLVEDEQSLAMIMKDTMEPTGMSVTLAADGEEGLRAFFADKPDVLVTDVMMPRMDGFEMVRRIREQDKLTPVLFLTARSSVNDVVNGFKMGGDDYLKKPFSLQEFMARVSRLAERQQLYCQSSSSEPEDDDHWTGLGTYRLNPVTQQLAWQEHVEELSHREAELLRMLAEHVNDVVESHDILLALWGDDTLFNGRSLQVFITKLHHRLEHDPQLRIVNVRGIGYKLIIS
jgi:two-component system response regulator TrcR